MIGQHLEGSRTLVPLRGEDFVATEADCWIFEFDAAICWETPNVYWQRQTSEVEEDAY